MSIVPTSIRTPIPGRPMPTTGWRSRDYLPHRDETNIIQHVTFRLADSLPSKLVARWREELQITPDLDAYDPRQLELRRRIEKYEDAGHGACWLRRPEIAELVQNALLHFDGERYRLLEWCIMPNHVHALLMPVNGHLLKDIIHSWKSYTAHVAKKQLNLDAPFWMIEYHDRYIRNDRHLGIVRDYIRQNPVAAGLVKTAESWSHGSAGVPPAISEAGETPALPCQKPPAIPT